jgi:hypothetical protein
MAREEIRATGSWNDFEYEYWCAVGAPAGTPTPNTLNIPPHAVVGTWYGLECPSTGIVHTPDPTIAAGDAQLVIGLRAVGGVAEALGAEAAPATSESSGDTSSGVYVVIAGVVAGAMALGAGSWYARRRWLS